MITINQCRKVQIPVQYDILSVKSIDWNMINGRNMYNLYLCRVYFIVFSNIMELSMLIHCS